MKELKMIISLILCDLEIEEKIKNIGVLDKVVGRIHVLKPLGKEIKNIGFVIEENRIRSVGLLLNDTIVFQDLIDEFSNNYYLGFNHYDEESVISFDYGELIIRAIKSGYIEKQELTNLSFERFDIIKK